MATITIRNQDGYEETFECDEDTYILEALEEDGLDHPSSCLLYTSDAADEP